MNQVYNQDCRVGMASIPDATVDLILTDPPYEEKDMREVFSLFRRVLKPTGSMYIFGDKNIVAEHWFSQLDMPRKDLLIWYYKNSPKPKGRWRLSMQALIYAYFDPASTWNEDAARVPYQPATEKLHGRMRPSTGRLAEAKPYDTSKGALPRDVIEHPALLGHLSRERVGHPDQKPLSLLEKLILTSSNPGDLVLDAYAGSGSTGVACLHTGRKGLLYESNLTWYNFIMENQVSDSVGTK